MMLPERYNRLFEEPDDKGQYADRAEVMTALMASMALSLRRVRLGAVESQGSNQ